MQMAVLMLPHSGVVKYRCGVLSFPRNKNLNSNSAGKSRSSDSNSVRWQHCKYQANKTIKYDGLWDAILASLIDSSATQ